jgi:c-di-GMP-binding flagellar brake protein YcgR
VVTSETIVFKSAAPPVPWAGRKVDRKLRSGLVSADWDAEFGLTTLRFRSETWELRGTDMEALAICLTGEPAPADASELGRAQATVTIADDAPVPGLVTLDGERLRFRPTGSQADLLDVAWSSIAGGQLAGIRPGFVARVAGQTIRIDGEAAGLVAAWVTAMAQAVREGTVAPPKPELDRWPAQRMRGALGIQGELRIGATQIHFVPNGLVERTLGLKDLSVPFDDIRRFSVTGWSTRKLVILTDHAREVFAVEDAEARFETLLDRIHAIQRQRHASPERSGAEVAAMLQQWSGADAAPTHLMEAHPGLQLRGLHDATPGVIVQTADEVRFLPNGGPTGPAPAASHPVPRILRTYSGTEHRVDDLCFSVEGEAARYLPAEGKAFVLRFWERCRSPSRIFHLDAPSKRAVARVLGPCRYIHMRGLDGQKVDVRGLEDEGRIWAAALDRPELLPAVGQMVSVDVGQPEGVYRFEMEVLDHDVDHGRVLFARPGTVRVYNQRRSYRVSVDLPARARMDGDLGPLVEADSLFGTEATGEPGLDLKLSDLSLGGCSAKGAANLPLGASIELEVDLNESAPLRVTGRVLRADPIDGSPLRRFGIRFERVRRTEEVRLQRHVLRAQRRELAGQEAMAM